MRSRLCGGYVSVPLIVLFLFAGVSAVCGEENPRQPPGRPGGAQIPGKGTIRSGIEGKGVLIMSIYNDCTTQTDQTEEPVGLASADYQLRFLRAHPDLVPDGITLPEPAGHRGNGSACYTSNQILTYLMDCGAKWVAVKSSDGERCTPKWEDGLVVHPGRDQFTTGLAQRCRDRGLKLLAWVRLDGNVPVDNQADAAIAALEMPGVSGLLIMPSGQDPTLAYTDAMAGDPADETAGDAYKFINKIRTRKSDAFIAYSLETEKKGKGQPCFPPGDTCQQIVHDKIIAQLDKQNTVLMPRFFWHGGLNQKNFETNAQGFAEHWNPNNGISVTKGFDVIPIVQCERTKPKGQTSLLTKKEKTVKDSRILDAHTILAVTDPVHVGIGVYLFDGFKAKDHEEFALVECK